MPVDPLPWNQLTGREQARLARLGIRGGRRVLRGKDTAGVDRQIDRIYIDAGERIAAEDDLRQQKRAADIQDKAARRIARRR
jgi:hypothetical protein